MDAATPAPTAAPVVAPTPAPMDAATPAPTAAPVEAPTPAPMDAATPAPTAAPVEAPTPAPIDAATPAPTAAPVDAPTPAPTPTPIRRLRSRRLAAGEMLVVARFSDTANVTLADVEAASDDIVLEVNKALDATNAMVTVSSLTVSAPEPIAPTPAPTPAATPAPTPKAGDSSSRAAVISRVDLWVSALALLLCSGRV